MADDIRLSASMQDDVTAALVRIEQRISALQDDVAQLGRTSQRSGTQGAQGMNKLARAADEVAEETTEAAAGTRKAGNEATKTGAKARGAAASLKKMARSANRTTRSMAGLNATLAAFKIAGLVTGVFALAGGISALGAGAAIAVSGLAPMAGVLAGLLPMFLAARLAMLAVKLAASELEGPLTRIKTQFAELGPVIAGGGLRSGLDYLATAMDEFVQVTGQGLRGLGAEIGRGAQALGDWLKSPPLLRQVSTIFSGLRPILASLIQTVLSLGRAFLNITEGALPLGRQMAETVSRIAGGLADWTAEVLANGRMTVFLQKAWTIFTRTVTVLVDLVIGAYNVFRVAGHYANEFGVSAENAAAKFRAWTESAEGQARIAKYFQDSLPALREIGRLVGMAAAGFAGLAANQNVAPLLEQIRTQFAPAFGELVAKLSGEGGLGPALIDAATAVARLLTAMDFSGLTMFVQAIAGLANGIVWLTQNVPGASFVVSGLLSAFLGFKVLAPVFSLLATGSKAFKWISGVAEKSKILQSVALGIGKAFTFLGGVFRTVGLAIVGVIRTIGVAFMSNPIGLAITIIIGLIALIYFKFEWFRDAAIAVWEWIANAAKVSWDFIVGIWNGVVEVATSIWNDLVSVWRTVMDAISFAVTFLWENGIKPIWDIIYAVAMGVWEGIKFYIQTVVYVIVGIITLIAIAAKAVWDVIAASATWLWENGIKPVWDAIAGAAMWVWNQVGSGAKWLADTVGGFFTWLWDNWIKPFWDRVSFGAQMAWDFLIWGLKTVNDFFGSIFGWIWNGLIKPFWDRVSFGAQVAWDLLMSGVQKVSDFFRSVWEPIAEFFTWLWDKISSAGSAAWDKIKSAAESVGGAIKSIWNGVMDVVKAVWNFVAKSWNSIPSFTVPDWIPLIGGKTFSLPKLPTLWHGGEAPGGKALVGEHGPEPVIRNGQLVKMVGLHGPEIADIPRGGYVVPNLRTLDALPGLAKSLPAGVATAVSRAVPGYAGALQPRRDGSGGGALAGAVRQLAGAVSSQMPPVHVHGHGDIRAEVLAAWRQHQREERARGRYDYTAGRG